MSPPSMMETLRIDQRVNDLERDFKHLETLVLAYKESYNEDRFKLVDELYHFRDKMHRVSGMIMQFEERMNEIAAYCTLLEEMIYDLRKGIESASNRSNTDSETTV